MGNFPVTRTLTRSYPYPPTHGSALCGSPGARGCTAPRSGHVLYYQCSRDRRTSNVRLVSLSCCCHISPFLIISPPPQKAQAVPRRHCIGTPPLAENQGRGCAAGECCTALSVILKSSLRPPFAPCSSPWVLHDVALEHYRLGSTNTDLTSLPTHR